MKKYKRGENRNKYALMPRCLDEYIDEDNIVRVIDKIVDSFDMEAMNFKNANPTGIGRTPYDPKDMLKLYIYGYLNGYRSTRRLEKECKRNLEVKWLMNNLTPHNKTISNFRHDNLESFTLAFAQFLYICNEANLIGKEIIAVDGSKVRANNGRSNYLTENKVKKKIDYFKEKIVKYIEELDSEDIKQTQEASEKIAHAEQRIEELEEILEVIKQEGSIALLDSDAKMMKTSNNGMDVAHNAQIGVDGKHNIVVVSDVISNPSDAGQLSIMIEKTIETLDIDVKVASKNEEEEKLKVLADKGYYQCEDLVKCEKIAETYVAKPSSPQGAYGKVNFIYNKESNIYICPEGEILTCHSGEEAKTKLYFNKEACSKCVKRELCTKTDYRKIAQKSYEDVMQIVDERTSKNLDLYRKRQTIVEPVFGILKRVFGLTYFLTRGNKSVKAELDLSLLSYNILRAKNILGTQRLIEIVESISSNILNNIKGLLVNYTNKPFALLF